MKFVQRFTAAVAATMITFSAAPVAAEKVSFELIIGLSEMVPVVFDEVLEEQNSKELMLHLSMSIPRDPSDDKLFTIQSNFNPDGNWLNIRFISQEGFLAQAAFFSTGMIDLGDFSDRQAVMVDVIELQILPSLGELVDFEGFGSRATEIAGMQAVQYIATYNTEDLGQVGLQIVGIFPPGGERVMYVVEHSILNQMEINGPPDMKKTFVGVMMESIEFIGSRDANGVLQNF